MRVLIATILLGWAVGALAFGDFENNDYASAKARAKAVAAAGAKAKTGDSSAALTVQEAKQNIPPIAPNPSAPPPSAQCRYAWSATLGLQEFGTGITASEWDRICGLWMAAQQTTGAAKQEAAAAAFCITMKDAGVKSKVCETWEDGQGTAEVVMNDNKADVRFGGAGGWN